MAMFKVMIKKNYDNTLKKKKMIMIWLRYKIKFHKKKLNKRKVDKEMTIEKEKNYNKIYI
jgi:hypothetical protein